MSNLLPKLHIRNTISFLLMIIFLFSSGITMAENQNILCAHAGGQIDDYVYTNSLEAMEYSYKIGYRVIEVDLILTSDGVAVCEHDWDYFREMTQITSEDIDYETYISSKKYGKYTSMDLDVLFRFMIDHEDCIVYLDTKYTDCENNTLLFTQIIETARRLADDSLLDRLWVSILSKEMFTAVDRLFHFKHYVYASYLTWDGTYEGIEEWGKWCTENGIEAIDMWNYQFFDEIVPCLQDLGLSSYVFTINDIDICHYYFNLGVKCITTDNLLQ